MHLANLYELCQANENMLQNGRYTLLQSSLEFSAHRNMFCQHYLKTEKTISLTCILKHVTATILES